ncbi:aminotransferase class V-fold PLP-dependent enzyme [Neobacillus sp. DY30]|uniref:aminotransferase class V-fold PLP-dependent enzyme n=1 Tax=Neobacillus sp. DY30 TaxID=3047871 RepID=UPI0024C00FE6|nr:aminotransferase class V-fold PLP-dependent enzyme [Neobacillus sp. DY30]WHY00026.1 aminotransferase class V-fold PLP-dependent enzyme [Neobacillus sp. DY30]
MSKHEFFFKIATTADEFEQIHRLNYQTFSEEIPQHAKNEEQKLVDPFHAENTYIICVKENEVIGMTAIRDKRPFSLDRKIGPVEQSLSFPVFFPCEVRLLSVKKEYRNGRVFLGLAQFLIKYCLKKGYDIAFISGTVRQLKLYGQLGFQPFAQLTGTDEALFQPMYLTKKTFDESIAGRILPPTIPFLPGPVQITKKVMNALSTTPISHRSEHYKEKIARAKDMLAKLVNSKYVHIFLGSGTLANDVVAGQLSLESGRGLILANGEFGSRLVEQAKRFGLQFDVLEKDWGQAFTRDELISAISETTSWIWAVHSETSSGMLNDLGLLKEISEKYELKLCLDCISSLGAIEIDLDGVFLATGVSGKAIRGLTGLSFVFHHHEVQPSLALPKFLDLGTYMAKGSVPFSQSSNLLEALLAALEDVNRETFEKVIETHTFLKNQLIEFGFTIISEHNSSPMILTIEIPSGVSSVVIGDILYHHGYQLHYESDYLQQRNWIQIACIDHYDKADLEKMTNLLNRVIAYEQKSTQHTLVNGQ